MLYLIALVGLTSGAIGDVASAESLSPPSFAVTLKSGELKIYASRETKPGEWAVNDSFVSAKVAHCGANEWELTLIPRQPIRDVKFPWAAERMKLGESSADDVVLLPHWAGMAYTADSISEWHWTGLPYPSVCFAPLAVLMDSQEAFTVAATNWPPRRVSPMYAGGRIILAYDDPIPAGLLRTYRALIVRTSNWREGIDRYRQWLDLQMRMAGIDPPRYSDALKRSNGWLNIQLENLQRFDAAALEQKIKPWKQYFNRVQFWGQMSNYAGPAEHAQPALRQGETVGCCLEQTGLHDRYRELIALARRLERSGTTVGYYVRPRAGESPQGRYAPLDDPAPGPDGKTNLQFLLEWSDNARTKWGGTAVYVDVYSAVQVSHDLLYASRVLRDAFPPDTVCEGVRDIDPTAFLMSGFVSGGTGQGGPGKTFEGLGTAYTNVTFPAFSRFLLGDRIFFLGQSNTDYRSWGKKNSYWVERQAFLLGAKLDVMSPADDPATPDVMNVALRRILDEWGRVDWWKREPVYRDKEFLTEIPKGIDARRFIDKAGKELVVIDNWNQREGLSLKCRDRAISIPGDRLAIVAFPE